MYTNCVLSGKAYSNCVLSGKAYINCVLSGKVYSNCVLSGKAYINCVLSGKAYINCEASWQEQRQFSELALRALGFHPIMDFLRESIKQLTPSVPDLLGQL